MMMDCFLYMLYIFLMVNVIIALLPDLFSSLVAFSGRFMSKQVMILFFISVFLLVVSSFMRMCMLGPLVYGMENLFYALTRNLMQYTGSGYFLESGVTIFGITENLESATES